MDSASVTPVLYSVLTDTLVRPRCDMDIKGELIMVAREGIEPPTRGFSILLLSNTHLPIYL